MLGLATTKDLELVEDELAKAIEEICFLGGSLQLMTKKVQQLEKDNEFLVERVEKLEKATVCLMAMRTHRIEDETKPKKVATKTIKPRKKTTKKEV